MGTFKKITAILVATVICICGFFVYEVKRKHHYTPRTAEIILNDEAGLENAFMLKDGVPVEFNMAEQITFLSDIEKGTANLETTKKVFGFYECDINWVYDEYTPAVTYRSSDTNVAAVDENGVITATAKGKTTITVTADSVSIDIPLTVYKVVEVTELEQNVVLLKGETKSFLKLGEYEVPRAEFHSSNEKIVTVNREGKATAVGKGKAEVYTYRDEGESEKVSTQITVKQPVESASMKGISLYIGETATLKVSYTPGNADYGTDFKFSTPSTDVVSIKGNVATALKEGEAIITATSSNGVMAKAKLTVSKQPVATPAVKTITKEEFEKYDGEKYSDKSPYASYFKITFDQPVLGFRINYVNDNGTKKTTGDAIYNNAQVAAGKPLYFAICINESDVLDTRGFSYSNKDGSKKYYSLHQSGKDGSVLMTTY